MISIRLSMTLVLFSACGDSPVGADGGASDSGAVETPDGGAADAPPDAAPPALVWGPCPERFRDECATIAMPLDHAHPEGETIDVLISRRGPGSRQLWLLQGGPGGSAERFFGLHDFLAMVDPELEVYTIEHRGVGESTRLGCGSERPGSRGGVRIVSEEWASCRDDVVAEWGDRLDFFSTTGAAHDLARAIELTRRPEQSVFVYGGSYGTFWANRFAVLHPDLADGVVLDGPLQPESSLADYDLWFEAVGRRVFSELCPRAPRCAEHLGPDPLAFFERVFTSLEEGHCGELGVDLATWKLFFALALMDYNLRNWLPALVYRLDRCSSADMDAIAMLFSSLFGGGGGGLPRTSYVLQNHVVFSELWPRTHVDEAAHVAARATSRFFQDANGDAFALQDSWPRYDLDPLAAEYAPPSVPVLVMVSPLDPATPPAIVGYGYRDHLTGPHQTFVEIPFGAHTVLTAGFVADMPACPVQLVRAFFADPTSELPVECAGAVLHPAFDANEAALMRFWGTDDLYD
jgi:pimeloyl-ACP methyl ester carboxylesterase